MRHSWVSLLIWALLVGLAGTASAELQTIGKGKQTRLVPDQFAGEMSSRFDLFARRCTKCHEMSRPIAALTTGITPVSGGVFDKQGIKKYVVKMMRKPNSGIAKKEAKEILLFLLGARDMAKR